MNFKSPDCIRNLAAGGRGSALDRQAKSRGEESMFRLIRFIVLITMSVPVAIGQTSGPPVSSVLATHYLPDGSIVKLLAVSYGSIHRMPSYHGQPGRFYKSALPTIMFTTSRQAPTGHDLFETKDLWTKAEAQDSSGCWYPLRMRTGARPVKEGLGRTPSFIGPLPTEMWETWEFPSCPDPSPWLRVRITAALCPSRLVQRLRWLLGRIGVKRHSTRRASVEFKLPNDELWRERSAKEEAVDFHPQEWLNDELVRAAWSYDESYVEDLISQGADPNSSDSAGASALLAASANGRTDVVRYLLDHGANVNAHGIGKALDRTALIGAASAGKLETIRLLVDRGADVNTRGGGGDTALVWAARGGYVECVKYLLSKGADPRIKALDGTTEIELIEKMCNTNFHAIIELPKKSQLAH
jgi:hypothetical protein